MSSSDPTAPSAPSEPGQASIVVLPIFPHERTGGGQRSRHVIEAATGLGPTHVVLLQGGKAPPAEALPGVASISVLKSATPIAAGGAMRLLRPKQAYRTDPELRAQLLALARREGAARVIFRYVKTFSAAGLTAADGLDVFVDVDDRDDQKFRTRLDRMAGPWLARSPVGALVLSRLARTLKRQLRAASEVWFASPEDIWDLGPARTAVLPNVPFWDAPAEIPAPGSAAPMVLFVGVQNHPPNQDGVRWFLDGAWGEIRAACPEAELRIVGRGDWAGWGASYADHAGVHFVGEVADLEAEYARARLAICPVREGGGSKIKVIEAAAFARPVVATPHALRGFDGAGLEVVRQAADPTAFATACAALLSEPETATTEGQALQAWQSARYSRQGVVAWLQARLHQG